MFFFWIERVRDSGVGLFLVDHRGAVRFDGGKVHQDRMYVGLRNSDGCQVVKSPGIDVAPITHLTLGEPRGVSPPNIGATSEDRDRAGHLGQRIARGEVLDDQHSIGRKRGRA